MNKVRTIGIVGGGQLGRMLTEAAQPLGFKVVVVDPAPNCPAAQAGASQVLADFTDAAAITKLANQTDVLTIEFEHINTKILSELAKKGKPVEPEPSTLKMIQDKLVQCRFLAESGIPLAEFREVKTPEEARQALEDYGGKMILKNRHNSYDGKGNAVIKSEKSLAAAWQNFAVAKLYVERLINFKAELAVIIARDLQGNISTYPVVETIHVNNICHEVLAPPNFDKAIKAKAEELAINVAKHLKGAGVFAVEMFLTQDHEILVNEIAPRVHNSGHLTIEACETSQFEQHVRAITGMGLGSTKLKMPAVMINILGERNGAAKPEGAEEAERLGQVYVHIYGKAETRVGRKMGHITAVADTIKEAKRLAEAARQKVSI